MASKKKLEAAVEAARAELTAAQTAYRGAADRVRAASQALDAACLAIVQSKALSDAALAFLSATAMPGGYTYYRRSRFGATIRKLEGMGFVALHRGQLDRVTVIATDAGRARLKGAA